jgi:hypothetical protein
MEAAGVVLGSVTRMCAGGDGGAKQEVRGAKVAEEAAWQEKCFLFDDFFCVWFLFVLLVVGVLVLLRRAPLLRRGLVLSPP